MRTKITAALDAIAAVHAEMKIVKSWRCLVVAALALPAIGVSEPAFASKICIGQFCVFTGGHKNSGGDSNSNGDSQSAKIVIIGKGGKSGDNSGKTGKGTANNTADVNATLTAHIKCETDLANLPLPQQSIAKCSPQGVLSVGGGGGKAPDTTAGLKAADAGATAIAKAQLNCQQQLAQMNIQIVQQEHLFCEGGQLK
jgi:hypothetical protein